MNDITPAIISGAVAFAVAILGIIGTALGQRAQFKNDLRRQEKEFREELDKLKQAQISDIIRRRIEVYPSLWELCQESITRPRFSEHRVQVSDGWASTLSDNLEAWHSENGVFLSESSYVALHRLRKRARVFAEESNTAAAANSLLGEQQNSPLGELEVIWTSGFDDNDEHHDGLATSLKNDLGSYMQPVISRARSNEMTTRL